MVSIVAFDKPCSGAKTSRMGTLKESFENAFENLGVVSTLLRCFQKWLWANKVGHGVKRSCGFKREDIGDYVLTRGN
jgi:hypothetical protein